MVLPQRLQLSPVPRNVLVLSNPLHTLNRRDRILTLLSHIVDYILTPYCDFVDEIYR